MAEQPPVQAQQFVVIDPTAIYALLLEVRDQGQRTDSKVDSLIEDKKDHESRIRTLEQRKTISPWQLWTAIGSGVALFGGALTILRGLGVG